MITFTMLPHFFAKNPTSGSMVEAEKPISVAHAPARAMNGTANDWNRWENFSSVRPPLMA
jgi:hypothetical protein